ncbi:MAG: hypothetical protein ACRDTM_07760 [Micromonosporaceae bacterium]
MQAGPVVRRLLSPGGFVLVAVCFLLPFLTVSCEAEGHRGELTYQGTDLVVGGAPDVAMDGMTRDELPEALRSNEQVKELEGLEPQPFAIASLLLILVGAATALLPTVWSRALGGLACAAVAVMFLVAAQTILRSDLRAGLDPEAAQAVGVQISDRYGFWLAVGLLAGVTALNLLLLVIASREPPEAGPDDALPTTPLPPPQASG